MTSKSNSEWYEEICKQELLDNAQVFSKYPDKEIVISKYPDVCLLNKYFCCIT